jgi:hypothetical protein
MKISYAVALPVTGLALSASAADLTVKVELPRLQVAEYHNPYVAIWVEKPDQSFAANLAVWYGLKMKNDEGTKWLKDMRTWWRKSGRELTMPVDGVSGATRAPGVHTLNFADGSPAFKALPAGEYQLVVETAREVGGRELVRVPFVWKGKAATTGAKGETELGAISVSVAP